MEWQAIEALFQLVMDDLGYEGWSIRRLESDAYCWREDRIIDLYISNSVEECKQWLLHEIAHIDTAEPQGSQHTEHFWKHLEELTTKYLHSGLNQSQLKMRQMTGG